MFKRKKKTKEGLSWYDVTLDQFQRMRGLDKDDMGDQIEAASILLGSYVNDLTWGEFCRELLKLDFLKEEMPKTIIRKSYELNGRIYETKANLQDLSVTRYMDFMNQVKTGKLERILSVVLIPEGKEYGTYDMDQVYEDILTMSAVDATAVYNFFLVQFIVCIKTMKDFSVDLLKGNPELQGLVSGLMESYSMSDL